MKKKFWLPILLLFILFNGAIAQSSNFEEDFIKETDAILSDLSKYASDLYIRKSWTGKKTVIRGVLGSNSMRFQQKIKYRGTGKVEKLKVSYLTKNKAVDYLEVVLINDEYFYIRKATYSEGKPTQKVKEEILVDGKSFRRRTYGGKTDYVDTWNVSPLAEN